MMEPHNTHSNMSTPNRKYNISFTTEPRGQLACVQDRQRMYNPAKRSPCQHLLQPLRIAKGHNSFSRHGDASRMVEWSEQMCVRGCSQGQMMERASRRGGLLGQALHHQGHTPRFCHFLLRILTTLAFLIIIMEQ